MSQLNKCGPFSFLRRRADRAILLPLAAVFPAFMQLIKFLFSKTFVKNLGIAIVVAAVLFGGVWFYLNSYTDHGDYITVPNVSGLSYAEAQDKLDELQLRGALVDSVWRAEAIPGAICEQSPAPGEHVKSGRQVYLTSFRVRPSFVKIGVEEGERKNVAMIRLENKGISYRVQYEPHELLYDCVIRVEHEGRALEPKDEIRRDQHVTLVVGERRKQKVTVPRLFGMGKDSAEFVLNKAGLTLGFLAYDADIVTEEDSLSAWIYEQYPAYDKGQQVRIGSEVNLWLTNREKPEDKPEQDPSTDPDDPEFFD